MPDLNSPPPSPRCHCRWGPAPAWLPWPRWFGAQLQVLRLQRAGLRAERQVRGLSHGSLQADALEGAATAVGTAPACCPAVPGVLPHQLNTLARLSSSLDCIERGLQERGSEALPCRPGEDCSADGGTALLTGVACWGHPSGSGQWPGVGPEKESATNERTKAVRG